LSKFEDRLSTATKRARDQARNLLLNPGALNPLAEDQESDLPSEHSAEQIPKENPGEKSSEASTTITADPIAQEVKLEEQDQELVSTAIIKPPKKQKEQPRDLQYAYRPKVHKSEKIHDTHTSQAYMIENELIAIMNDIIGDTWGGKYRFVNESIKLMIYQEFPEYIDRIRVKE
jgi:hypothetical protein